MIELVNIIGSIPIIFAYWMGLLIVWSVLLVVDLNKMFKCISKCHRQRRTEDHIHRIGLIVGTVFSITTLFYSVFVSSVLMDIFFGTAIWYTGYLIFVSARVYSSIVRIDPKHLNQNHHTVFDFLFHK